MPPSARRMPVEMKCFYNVYAICAFAAIGGGLFGFDISSMSGVLGTQGYTNYFGLNGGSQQGAVTAAMPAGSLVGALASSFVADYYSRRTAIQIAAVIWICGAILQTASNGIPLLVVGRIVAGICVGMTSAIVPVYQAEIAPREIRGRVVTMQQWAITWGIFIQYFVQYGASKVDGGPDNQNQGSAAFRIPWGIQIIPAAILFAGMFFFPKTPRWLASKDRWEEAIKVLGNLHGNGDINHPKVLAEYQEIEETLRGEREQANSGYTILTRPRIARRVILGMSIQMWSQLSGMNVMMYYTIYVMQGAGIGDALTASSVNYVLNVVLTLPALLFLDKWGRRPTMLLGSFFMGTFLFLVGALEGAYGEDNPDPNGAVKWILPKDQAVVSRVVVAFSYLAVCTFATSWGPVSWTYPSEIYPNQVRAKAVSLATASNWIWNTALAFAVPPLLDNIKWRMYMIFGVFNYLAFIHMFLLAPETKGIPLEEMDDIFDSGRPAWKSKVHTTRLERLQKEIEDGNFKVAVHLDKPMHHAVEDMELESKDSQLVRTNTATTQGSADDHLEHLPGTAV
ncbi:MAG: MFS sugar transporter [Stictis urceolatum]|nr:MFS sugar transporter [Stictis urceolata]